MTEIEYIKKDGKVYRREINEEEFNVDAQIEAYENQLNTLNSLKTEVISKLTEAVALEK